MAHPLALPPIAPARIAASNAEVGAVFDEIADWLELDGANPFRVRAYRNAARALGGWPQPLNTWRDAEHPLADLPGIGDDLAGKIEEILADGSCKLLRELRRTHPCGPTALLKLPGSVRNRRSGCTRSWASPRSPRCCVRRGPGTS